MATGFERLHYLLGSAFDADGNLTLGFLKVRESYSALDSTPVHASHENEKGRDYVIILGVIIMLEQVSRGFPVDTSTETRLHDNVCRTQSKVAIICTAFELLFYFHLSYRLCWRIHMIDSCRSAKHGLDTTSTRFISSCTNQSIVR